MPNYRFDAFKLNVTASGDIATVSDIIREIDEGGGPNTTNDGGYVRELWRARQVRNPNAWFGQFRKFRQGDLPLVGAPGEEGHELEIEDDEALIEKNLFLVVPPHDILLWLVNGHANTPNQFTRFLSKLAGTKVTADPIVQPDAMRRLMRGNLVLKKVQMRVARPTDATWYPADDFSKEIFEVMAKGGGDSLLVEASVDGRLAPSRRHALALRWKRAFRDFVNDGHATMAKVDVIEDGIEYPIDLLADRLVTSVQVDHDGRYAPAETMLGALQAAWTDIEPMVTETFGLEGNALRR